MIDVRNLQWILLAIQIILLVIQKKTKSIIIAIPIISISFIILALNAI